MSLLMILSLVGAAFLVFFNAIHHPFVHDDVVFILQNPQIGRLNHLGDIFFQTAHFSHDPVINVYYRPLLEIFYRLEYKLFGFNAAGFHFINILIHTANGLLLLGLLCRLQFNRWLAFCVSLVFLIHPLQSEAVACVAGVSNLLMAWFVLLTVYFYVRGWHVLSLFIMMLALLTKEQAVMVPLVLILVDWYRKTESARRWLVFFIVTLGFLWIRSTISDDHMLENFLQYHQELRLRLLAIPRTLLMYLRLVTVPYDLHYYRNTDILADNSVGFLLLTLLVVSSRWLVKRLQINTRAVIFGVAWFLLTLVPVLNIAPLISEYSFILTSEHFLYLPLVGVVIIFMMVISSCLVGAGRWPAQSQQGQPNGLPLHWNPNTGRWNKILFSVVCIILASLTIYQNTFWRGEVPLFERMARFEPHFGRGQLLLARAYTSNGLKTSAILHYRQALAIMEVYERKAANDKSKRYYQGLIKTMSFELNQIH